MAEYINVTTLNLLAKQVLEQCEPLNNLIVCGEVSNFTRHYKSGHCYFTLKDENAAIKCVMFRDKARLLGFAPENGMLVLAYGRATLYERDGAFQLYCDYMRPFGAGAAQMAFDALKKKLSAEGLFDADHKRPLPPMPQCIGLVTSKTGAALQDVIHIITRRWPMVKLLLAPVSVQGLEAEKSIVDGIRRLDADPRPDIILITRGGGSKEDLWVFNSERIARAAYACKKPVVSAVGHEIDTTILDYVADLRAPTPSAAAELCVPDQAQVRHEIFILQQNIQKNIQSRLEMCYNKFNIISPAAAMQNEKTGIDVRTQLLRQTTAQIQAVAAQKAAACTQGLHTAAAVAASLNPYAVLARGYTMVADARGRCLTTEHLKPGQKITVIGSNAAAQCTVDAVAPTQGNPEKEQTDEST